MKFSVIVVLGSLMPHPAENPMKMGLVVPEIKAVVFLLIGYISKSIFLSFDSLCLITSRIYTVKDCIAVTLD